METAVGSRGSELGMSLLVHDCVSSRNRCQKLAALHACPMGMGLLQLLQFHSHHIRPSMPCLELKENPYCLFGLSVH